MFLLEGWYVMSGIVCKGCGAHLNTVSGTVMYESRRWVGTGGFRGNSYDALREIVEEAGVFCSKECMASFFASEVLSRVMGAVDKLVAFVSAAKNLDAESLSDYKQRVDGVVASVQSALSSVIADLAKSSGTVTSV